MNSEYNRPGQRVRSFGAGMLSGSAVSQEDVVNQLQENFTFRLNSLRDMLMGNTSETGSAPVQRRMEIASRRRSLIMDFEGPLSNTGGNDSSTSSTSRSGSISASGNSGSGSSSDSTAIDTPSMSEVDRGTKARAENNNFN